MTIKSFSAPVLLMCVLALPRARAGEPARSEPYLWKNVKVGGGGFIPGIVFSRVEKGLAYLRSDMGGCYRWDDAPKQWIPLNDAIGESRYHPRESIPPDPVDANPVYNPAPVYPRKPSAVLRSRDTRK